MERNPTTKSRTVTVVHRRRRVLVASVLLLAVFGIALAVKDLAGLGVAGDAALSTGVPLDSGYFARGACMAFEPTSGGRHLTVFLDAGHGGLDPGGIGTTTEGRTIEESVETLPVELDAKALLRAQGFRVVVSRTGPSSVLRLGPADVSGNELTLQGTHDDVAARDVCANDAQANALVGIYYDAGVSSDDAGSLTAYDADRPFASSNLRLADLVQRDVVADMNAQGWGIPDDGVQSDTTLGSFVGSTSDGGIAADAATYDHLLVLGPAQSGFFSTPSLMPGAVVEPLYLTDPYEGTIANTVHGQHVIAEGIATAVEQFFQPKLSKRP